METNHRRSLFYFLLTGFILLSGQNTTLAQSVATCHSSYLCTTNCPSACADDIKFRLTVTNYAENSCNLVFTAPAGACIITNSVVIPNQPAGLSYNITNCNTITFTHTGSTGTPYSGIIELDVEITGCNIYNNTLPVVYPFITTFSCGSVFTCGGNQSATTQPIIERPLIGFDTLDGTNFIGDGALTLQNRHYLKFDVVDRYYRIIPQPNSGKTDFFTLDITAEPEINILSVRMVDNFLSPIPNGNLSGLITGGSTAQIIFNNLKIITGAIDQTNQPGIFASLSHIDNNYIIIHEQIEVLRVQGPDFPTNVATQYTLQIHCDEDPGTAACVSVDFALDVRCRQKSGGISHGIYVYDPNFQTYNQNFPALAVPCIAGNSPMPDAIDYTIRFTNNFNDPVDFPDGSGSIEVLRINFSINPQYFEFDAIRIGTGAAAITIPYSTDPDLGYTLDPVPGNVTTQIQQNINISSEAYPL